MIDSLDLSKATCSCILSCAMYQCISRLQGPNVCTIVPIYGCFLCGPARLWTIVRLLAALAQATGSHKSVNRHTRSKIEHTKKYLHTTEAHSSYATVGNPKDAAHLVVDLQCWSL